MADTLLDYLVVAPPTLSTEENDNYSWRDINNVGHFSEFTYAHIMRRYGSMLHLVQIAGEPMPNSPPQSVNTVGRERTWTISYTSGTVVSWDVGSGGQDRWI